MQQSTAIKNVVAARGFTLIELMVAITLGLILVTAVSSLYLTNLFAFKAQDDASRLEETARAAFDTLGFHIRQAGYVDVSTDTGDTSAVTSKGSQAFLAMCATPACLAPRTDDMLSQFFGYTSTATQYSTGTSSIHAVAGCEGAFSANTFTAFPWACSATAGPSSITISYQAQPALAANHGTVRTVTTFNDNLPIYNSSTGAGGDCAGNDVGDTTKASPAGPLAINRFYIDTTTNRLMCLGNGKPTAPKPIAEGVEDMRILYGILPATLSTKLPNDAYVAQYVPASSVSNWVNVLSIRVCLQVASLTTAQTAAQNASSLKYTDCLGVSHTSTDGKVRQISRSTYVLQNNIFTIPDALPKPLP
jgi:type IV pilus assembly protein PilW